MTPLIVSFLGTATVPCSKKSMKRIKITGNKTYET